MRTLLLAILLSAGLLGCADDLLQETPHTFITRNNFYQTEGDARAAVLYPYGILTNPDLYARWAPEILVRASGMIEENSNRPSSLLNWDASYDRTEAIWSRSYEGINTANAVVKYVPGIEGMDAALQNQYVAEARFLRALYYFNLVRFFGDVPLHLEPTESLEDAVKPRSPVEEVYDAIVADLQFAAENLPPRGILDPARADRGAAKALLAKVYVTRAGYREDVNAAPGTLVQGNANNWQKAHEVLLQLVDPATCSVGKEGRRLLDDFGRLWIVVSGEHQGDIVRPADEFSAESYFEINFSNRSDVWVAQVYGDVLRRNFVTSWFESFYEKGDYRREKTATNAAKNNRPIKFPRTGDRQIDNESNWIVMRHAEVMLLYAEVENELNGPTGNALNCVNALRERARKADGTVRKTPADFTPAGVGSRENFRQIIYDERVRELAEEGHIWFDWLRTGRMEAEVKKQKRRYDPRNYLFPIPQSQIDITEGVLTQNPGY